MMMAKRFGKIKNYEEWLKPKIVANALELLDKEIPKLKNKIKSVHLCFATDPFITGYPEASNLSLKIIHKLNKHKIKTTTLTKGVYPDELKENNGFIKSNEYGITLVSVEEKYRMEYEPYTATFEERINGLKKLHKVGYKTWVSIEPYPTPNIMNQDIRAILENIPFVNKVIFGRLNYNAKVSNYLNCKDFYNECCNTVINFCKKHGIEYYIKNGTYTH